MAEDTDFARLLENIYTNKKIKLPTAVREDIEYACQELKNFSNLLESARYFTESNMTMPTLITGALKTFEYSRKSVQVPLTCDCEAIEVYMTKSDSTLWLLIDAKRLKETKDEVLDAAVAALYDNKSVARCFNEEDDMLHYANDRGINIVKSRKCSTSAIWQAEDDEKNMNF